MVLFVLLTELELTGFQLLLCLYLFYVLELNICDVLTLLRFHSFIKVRVTEWPPIRK